MQSAHAGACFVEVRTCRHMAPGLAFGLHFGGILGARFATILLFGRPGVQIARKRECKKNVENQGPPADPVKSGNGGGGGGAVP